MGMTLEQRLKEQSRILHEKNVQLVNEIRERKKAEEAIKQMAYYDVLTKLPNRALLEDHLKQEINRTERDGKLLGILFIDLDHFKTINDTLGHTVGDQLLQAVAARLQQCLRKYDIIARFGGDEFIAVLSKATDSTQIASLTQRIIEALKIPFELASQKLYITSSIGIALYPLDGSDVVTLLKHADTAMYRVKELGRNSFQFYEPEMNKRVTEFKQKGTALCEALERSEFFLEYQPRVDIISQRLYGVEALIRWRHPEWGVIYPNEFIPIAEDIGVILPIGEWILKTACEQTIQWQKAGFHPVRMAVNLSVRQFRQHTLQQLILQILKESGLEPKWLELELTESDILKDTANTVATLRNLNQQGVSIALDDFGGYSSLNYLKILPVNTVKIDQGFVKNLPQNDDDVQIANAIIALAHSLKLKVVAEGVETKAQLEILKKLNCDLYQGFYFSQAVSPEKIAGLLTRQAARTV